MLGCKTTVAAAALTLVVVALAAWAGMSGTAGATDGLAPALSCPDSLSAGAGAGCPPPGVASVAFNGPGEGAVIDRAARTGLRAVASPRPPVVSVSPPVNVTCCSARLRGTVTVPPEPRTGRVTVYVQVERDGGPRPVEMFSPMTALASTARSYRLHSDWSPLPSCSSYRFWFIARDKYGTAAGGPQAFSTACPRRYVAWSIGQFYVGAPASAPALGTIDTQPAAKALGGALGKLGYASHTLLGGQQPAAILREAPAAAVLAVFDHADAGNILTHGKGTNICQTDGLVASGRYTFACAASRWLRFGALPAADLWSVRLMIFGGCRTARTARYYGSLLASATALGVNSVIGFRDNVYFPSSTRRAGRSTGDYFWVRFSSYVRNGDTIRTALQRARGDLVRHDGHRAWGYGSWVVSGAARDPGALRLTISGAHASMIHATADAAERDRRGDLVWYIAPATTSGARKLTATSAREVAARFLARQAPRIAHGRMVLISERPASHQQGELLESLYYRSRVNGVPGPDVAEVEIDLRSGKVSYEAAGQVTPRSRRFALTRAQAKHAAVAAVGGSTVVSTTRDIWNYPRWTVILHPDTKPAVTAAVDVDALNGHVVSIDETDPS